MKCRLTLLSTDHEKGPLRTEEVVGSCDHEPVKGKAFVMSAAPLVDGDVRLVSTSLVQECTDLQNVHEIMFRTENSNYKWEFLGFGN